MATGMPDRVTVTGTHVTITNRVDASTSQTRCTCGHCAQCDPHASGWAHQDHARTHAPWRRGRS